MAEVSHLFVPYFESKRLFSHPTKQINDLYQWPSSLVATERRTDHRFSPSSAAAKDDGVGWSDAATHGYFIAMEASSDRKLV